MTLEGGVTIDPASVSAANTFVPCKRYVSQLITQAALSAGATCTVALTGEPTAMIPQACYVVTDETTTALRRGLRVIKAGSFEQLPMVAQSPRASIRLGASRAVARPCHATRASLERAPSTARRRIAGTVARTSTWSRCATP